MAERENSYTKELLHEHISSADNIQDLASILQSIPLDAIQNMIHKYIDQSNQDEALHHLHHSLSIDELLPECIIQHILSFDDLHHGKSINTKWKQYSDRNEQMYVKAKLNRMMHDECNPDTNTTWVIHPYRKKLYKWEEQLKWEEPINTFNIDDAIQYTKCGDRILFNNGQYTQLPFDTLYIDKNLHFIGIGDNVVFKDQDCEDEEYRYIENEEQFIHIGAAKYIYSASPGKGNNLQIENVKFDLRNVYGFVYFDEDPNYTKTGHIVVNSFSKLMMRNCVMMAGNAGNGIVTKNASYLDIRDCEFLDYEDDYIAVGMAQRAHCTIMDCRFRDCAHSTKCLSHYNASQGFNSVHSGRISRKIVKPVCIGNSFINNGVSEKYYELTVDDFVDMIERWEEKHNGLTKKMALNKLISRFGITKRIIRRDNRFKDAINIIKEAAMSE